jgi:hypothetical protein
VQLDAVTAELRPRSDWEAVDLGIALVRRDFRRVFACWWLAMLPMLVVAVAVLHSHPLWLLALLWWWTPVSSRMVLFYLSRHLFGERPDRKSLLRELPRAVVRRFGFRMLWARLSPWRPLTMPVEDLEGLRGKTYAQRVKLLLRRGDSTVIVIALWRVGILVGLTIAIFQTAVMFLPPDQADRWKEFMAEWQAGGWSDPSPLIQAAVIAAVVLSMSLTDIFATGIGFGIYVNHRTWIEGWDVEIALRRLGNRLRNIAAVLLAGGLVLLSAPRSEAAAPAEPPAEVIRTIKAQKDFEVHKVTVQDSSSGSSGSGAAFGVLGFLGVVLGIGTLVALVGGLIWLCIKYRHLFSGGRGGKASKDGPPVAKVVMGLNVAPESLPKDIPAMVMELWQVGRRQEALSLLYRGTISKLIDLVHVEIEESDTESDCLRRVSSASPVHEAYFGGLTQVWMRLAYAREIPRDSEIQSLCTTWPFVPERRGQ